MCSVLAACNTPSVAVTFARPFNPASRGGFLLTAGPAITNLQANMFRISRRDDGFDADFIDRAREILRQAEPDRYRVDEIRAVPFPSGHTSRAWGRLICEYDGSAAEEPHP
jgi:hypothetical protein